MTKRKSLTILVLLILVNVASAILQIIMSNWFALSVNLLAILAITVMTASMVRSWRTNRRF